MLIDEQTKSFLENTVHFTPSHIKRLEKNASLLSSTLGLIELLRRKPEQDVRVYAKNQFKRIRISLNKPTQGERNLLKEARSAYYTFK